MKPKEKKLSFIQGKQRVCVCQKEYLCFYWKWKRCVWITGLPLGFPEGLSNGSLKSGSWGIGFEFCFFFLHTKRENKINK